LLWVEVDKTIPIMKIENQITSNVHSAVSYSFSLCYYSFYPII